MTIGRFPTPLPMLISRIGRGVASVVFAFSNHTDPDDIGAWRQAAPPDHGNRSSDAAEGGLRMQRAPQRALAGKERKIHHTTRAAQFFAQREIEEFLAMDEDHEWEATRPIPIRRRNGTSAAQVCTIGAAAPEPEIQLELPLWSPEVEVEMPRRQPRAPRPNGHPKPAVDRVIRYEPRVVQEIRPAAPRHVFSMKRFLFGCLLGSAAAAVFLVMALAALG
jgi:hypothetical protein